MFKLLNLSLIAGALSLNLSLSGCTGTRTQVLDTRYNVIRIGKGVKGQCYVDDGKGNWVDAGIIEVPIGWWAGAPPSQ